MFLFHFNLILMSREKYFCYQIFKDKSRQKEKKELVLFPLSAIVIFKSQLKDNACIRERNNSVFSNFMFS